MKDMTNTGSSDVPKKNMACYSVAPHLLPRVSSAWVSRHYTVADVQGRCLISFDEPVSYPNNQYITQTASTGDSPKSPVFHVDVLELKQAAQTQSYKQETSSGSLALTLSNFWKHSMALLSVEGLHCRHGRYVYV